METWLKFFRLIWVGAFCVSVVSSCGCDMGTYNKRFKERLKTTESGGAFSMPDEDGAGESE